MALTLTSRSGVGITSVTLTGGSAATYKDCIGVTGTSTCARPSEVTNVRASAIHRGAQVDSCGLC